MNNITKTFDDLSLVVKIILALPFLDIIWVVYRLLKSVEKKNVLGIVLAIVMLFVGIPFLWLVDIISLIVVNRVLWID